jgi:hypothetical protein
MEFLSEDGVLIRTDSFFDTLREFAIQGRSVPLDFDFRYEPWHVREGIPVPSEEEARVLAQKAEHHLDTLVEGVNACYHDPTHGTLSFWKRFLDGFGVTQRRSQYMREFERKPEWWGTGVPVIINLAEACEERNGNYWNGAVKLTGSAAVSPDGSVVLAHELGHGIRGWLFHHDPSIGCLQDVDDKGERGKGKFCNNCTYFIEKIGEKEITQSRFRYRS